MEIKASDVKALREATGAGMMECIKALMETDGDADKAAKLLKEKGLAAVAKRADRATAEGRIFVRTQGSKIAMVELTCETDFVAKNADFIALGNKMLDVTFEKKYTKVEKEHQDLLLDLATKIRENMSVRRIAVIDIPSGAVAATYVHSDFKTGVIVVIRGSTEPSVKTFAYDCCLHMAAFTPEYLTQKDVPQSYIDEQTEIFKGQIEQDEKIASKPQNVKDGILKGKISKHLAEVCFIDQMFVKDDKKTVSEKMTEIGKEVGAKLEFGQIILYVLGK
jgi:elongation factor Ts